MRSIRILAWWGWSSSLGNARLRVYAPRPAANRSDRDLAAARSRADVGRNESDDARALSAVRAGSYRDRVRLLERAEVRKPADDGDDRPAWVGEAGLDAALGGRSIDDGAGRTRRARMRRGHRGYQLRLPGAEGDEDERRLGLSAGSGSL